MKHTYLRAGCLADLYVVGEMIMVKYGRTETIVAVRPTKDGDVRVITEDRVEEVKA